ncbi:glycine cleavage system protein GcvH [Stygiolobus caldivivus]|uniref:Probable glycine cleavage system H protein n=1 Tax=Stygiolobus caldivivus TaxID=2824673 RepID=A0A8D5U9P2_9CREN|nr:glycine cleavage system protein GcvH [Stygiolobus caldivivus]BCU71244.1 glycine cleavage system protein H [Stygiolobus caldivivus]
MSNEEIVGGKYKVLKDRYYTETDEWITIENNTAKVGITDYAQKKLRDIVGVDLPQVGREVRLGEQVATVESVKAAADIYSPLSGKITEVNEELTTSPELINKDPYGNGWIFKLELSDTKEIEKLLSYEQYIDTIKKREGL